jgi:Protein of unknown function (DUF3302)
VSSDEEQVGGKVKKSLRCGSWERHHIAVLFFLGVSFLALLVFVLGLPGRIAIARRHPEAEAANIMGWTGFLAIVPWIQAFIWVFKPTDPKSRRPDVRIRMGRCWRR